MTRLVQNGEVCRFVISAARYRENVVNLQLLATAAIGANLLNAHIGSGPEGPIGRIVGPIVVDLPDNQFRLFCALF